MLFFGGKEFTEVDEIWTELGGGRVYQSFVLVQFVLWLFKEARVVVLHVPFGGSAWGVTLGKTQTK